MLVNAGGPSTLAANEALLTVIGFLEASVPRMVELIEAAAQGALKEGTFEECLVVNDRLTNVLADVEKEPGERRPLTPAAASSPVAAAAAAASSAGDSPGAQSIGEIDQGMQNLGVVGGGDSDVVVVGGKTTGLESEDMGKSDPFAGGPDLLAPTPSNPFTISESMGSTESAGAAGKKIAAADNDDDFDAFFRDRTSAP